MDKDQLTKGNELDQDISYHKREIERISNCIKRLALNDYCLPTNTIEIKIDGNSCNVLKDRLAVFLTKELDMVKNEKESLETEFKNL